MGTYEPDIQVRLFTGRADTEQEAADIAAGKLNEWEPFRNWRTDEGKSAYDVTTHFSAVEGQFVCVLCVVGQDRDGWNEQRESAYTGATERLR